MMGGSESKTLREELYEWRRRRYHEKPRSKNFTDVNIERIERVNKSLEVKLLNLRLRPRPRE